MGVVLKNEAKKNTTFASHMKDRQIGIVRGYSSYAGQLVIKLNNILYSLSKDNTYWTNLAALTLDIELLPQGTELVID